jgi:phosphatidylserine decarboxylase
MSNNQENKDLPKAKKKKLISNKSSEINSYGSFFSFFSGISINREGNFAILITLLITLFLLSRSGTLAVLGLVALFAVTSFFRDPARVVPNENNILVSPADGIIQDISETMPPEEIAGENLGKMRKVSIFLSVFDVHVNRMPCAATVEKYVYYPGKFFNASLDKASKYNERQTLVLRTSSGNHRIALVQIAGLIARRIVCYAQEGDSYKAGERYGIIKFGSRVDLYLPLDIKLDVLEGQRMIGGETVIAHFE